MSLDFWENRDDVCGCVVVSWKNKEKLHFPTTVFIALELISTAFVYS
jgi:hypothetical protein